MWDKVLRYEDSLIALTKFSFKREKKSNDAETVVKDAKTKTGNKYTNGLKTPTALFSASQRVQVNTAASLLLVIIQTFCNNEPKTLHTSRYVLKWRIVLKGSSRKHRV